MLKGEQLEQTCFWLFWATFDRGKQSFEMQLEDGASTNRHDWAAAAYEYGREKYL